MKRLLLISLLIIGCSSNNSMGPEDDCGNQIIDSVKVLIVNKE